MLVSLTALSRFGVVKDVRDFLLPPNAWTDARNVRFHNEGIYSTNGAKDIFSPTTITPYWNLHTFDANSQGVWIFAGLNKVHARIGGSNVDITRVSGDYAATPSGLWNGGVLGGIPILNNGVDVPQQWAPISAAQKLVDLQNWPGTWRAKSVRPFKNFLMAMNITETGTNFIHRVRTSHPAVPGAVPSSWDALDPTVDATRFDLPDVNSGALIDGVALRDVFVLGKQKALWGMQFIGGRSKFRIFTISESSGVISKNCMVPDPEGQLLFIATGEDVVITDGLKITSLLTKRLKLWLQANTSGSVYERSFCVTNAARNECWFCFPVKGSAWPNLALVWNKVDNSFTFREIGSLSYASAGLIPAPTSTWEQDTLPWDQDLGKWTETSHQPFLRPLVGVDPVNSKLLELESANVVPLSYVERTGLAIVGASSDGSPVSDLTKRKLISRVYLQGSGGLVTVSIGTQNRAGGPITWTSPKDFNLSNQVTVDFHEECLLWSIRLQSSQEFEISDIAVDVEEVGTTY